MEDKNRFSKLLEDLMSVAELKNYTLAQELQYDVSYISKWLSGRMIPAEKTEKKVLEGISRCIVDFASDDGRETLLSDYQVDDCEQLKMAIFDNLEAEYLYVRELQKNTGTSVASKTFYYPEQTLPQYIARMRHPVLRRVKSLNIMGAMDLMAVGHEYRLQITRIENEHMPEQRGYPDVHYSMLIDITPEKWDYIHDTIFLMNLLSYNVYIDFQIYGGDQAAGRMIFVVKNDYSISGMLISRGRCMSVVVSEEAENCNTLYNNIKMLCSRERLLFRRTTMRDMLIKYDYIHTLLSLNLRWLMGHMTEHFLSDELFEEIMAELEAEGKLEVGCEELRNIHRLTKNIVEESNIRLMIYESAFSNLVVNNELDFFNHRVYLTAEQRSHYMEHFLSLCEKNENLEIRLIYGQFVSDFEYIDDQCIFLTDTISYLRLCGNWRNNLLIINRSDIRRIFEKSFEEFWEHREDVVISDKSMIVSYIHHVVQGIHMIHRIEK
ncbi:MAG: hypothetical protein ACI4E0_12870 [Blautia sp.]